jgi:hypothetical protein
MSYIGNQVTSVPFVTDVFSGDGLTSSFGPMIRIPATAASILVHIGGIYQRPTIDYTVTSDTLILTSIPASGTNNIVVHHIGIGVMSTQIPGDGTVTLSKFSSSTNTSITGKSVAMSIVFGG